MKKAWYLSKTLWINVLAMLGIVLQGASGHEVMSPEVQSAIIVIVNFVLRLVTKHGLTVSKGEDSNAGN